MQGVLNSSAKYVTDTHTPLCPFGRLGKRRRIEEQDFDGLSLSSRKKCIKKTNLPRLTQLKSIGDGLRVKQSNLPMAGAGVFATTNFSQDDFLTWYDGIVMDVTSKERSQLACRYESWSHLKSIDRFTLIQGIRKVQCSLGAGSFINDGVSIGVSPNVIYVEKPEEKMVYIKAKREIKKGEELFVSYGKSYWDRFKKQMSMEYDKVFVKRKRVRLKSFKLLDSNFTH